IFANVIGLMPRVDNGAIVEVQSSGGDFLCYATLNRNAYICGRAISFEKGDPMASLKKSMARAIDLRKRFFANEDTTAIRLINAEGDGVPGLIVDRYGPVVVVQLTTLGMDMLKDWVV